MTAQGARRRGRAGRAGAAAGEGRTVGLAPRACWRRRRAGAHVVVIPGGKVEVIEVGEVQTLPGDDGRRSTGRPTARSSARSASGSAPTLASSRPSTSARRSRSRSAAASRRCNCPRVTSRGGGGLGVKESDASLLVTSPEWTRRSPSAAARHVDERVRLLPGEQQGRGNSSSRPPFKRGDSEIQDQSTFTEAELTPFDPRQGWAPAGRSWLKLGFDNTTLDRTGRRARCTCTR